VTASLANSPAGYILTFIAAALAAANVFGGYVVTDRMLRMFRKPVPEPPKDADRP
jgi:NAD(P) transhydrogenase subunit alpha